MKRYASVDAYLEDFPTPVQEILQKFRDTVRRAAPDAEEVVSYGMPAYKLAGVLVYFAAHTRHIGFYPTSTGIAAFKQELQRFSVPRAPSGSRWTGPCPTDWWHASSATA